MSILVSREYLYIYIVLRASYFKSKIVITNQISCYVCSISYIQESSVRFFLEKFVQCKILCMEEIIWIILQLTYKAA